jgi:hypothetical protein
VTIPEGNPPISTKEKSHHKHVLTIPSEIVGQPGWAEGEDLGEEVKSKTP